MVSAKAAPPLIRMVSKLGLQRGATDETDQASGAAEAMELPAFLDQLRPRQSDSPDRLRYRATLG